MYLEPHSVSASEALFMRMYMKQQSAVVQMDRVERRLGSLRPITR